MIILTAKIIKRILLGLFVFFLVLAGLVTYVIFWPFSTPQDAPTVAFKIKWGTSFSAVADDLQAQGLVDSARFFKLSAQILNKENDIKAGLFNLKQGMSNYHILKTLTSGQQSFIKITIPEGLSSFQIAGLLAKRLELDSARLVSVMQDPVLIEARKIPASSLEGYLFPETYLFTYGLSERQVVNELLKQFDKNVPDSLYDRAEGIGFTMHQIVTLASIIQGEAVVSSEMDTVSSVYHNRLNRRMLLQADPTVQYIISDGPRRLLHRDLQIDSPYNTYLYPGLPPGPINNPGRKAIYAALYPIKSDYIFFVANGDGTHSFTATLTQHLNAKKRLDALRRQIARNKKRPSDNAGNTQ